MTSAVFMVGMPKAVSSPSCKTPRGLFPVKQQAWHFLRMECSCMFPSRVRESSLKSAAPMDIPFTVPHWTSSTTVKAAIISSSEIACCSKTTPRHVNSIRRCVTGSYFLHSIVATHELQEFLLAQSHFLDSSRSSPSPRSLLFVLELYHHH